MEKEKKKTENRKNTPSIQGLIKCLEYSLDTGRPGYRWTRLHKIC